ncbi:hypothetical protein D3C85_1875550 [compost metagenome]
MKQLARLVNLLRPLTTNPAEWRPIEKCYLELPDKYPGQRWHFGSGDLRADFVMCFQAFWAVAVVWLILRNEANSKKGNA